jgi:hypothetical protein
MCRAGFFFGIFDPKKNFNYSQNLAKHCVGWSPPPWLHHNLFKKYLEKKALIGRS